MLTIIATVAVAASFGQMYSITRLQPISGYDSFTPQFINNTGAVAGISTRSADERISIWRNESHVLLPVITDQFTLKGFNDSGLLGMNVWRLVGDEARIYKGLKYKTLPLLNDLVPDIVGLNNLGQVLVSSGDTNAIWLDNRYQIIQSTSQTFLTAINNAGSVCGVTRQFNPDQLLGFIWNKGEGMRPLGNDQGIGTGVSVIRLNDLNEILVEYNDQSYLWRAGRYKRICSHPYQAWLMNNHPDIIGYTNGGEPFILRNGQPIALGNLVKDGAGWQLQYVTGINNSGWIIGVGLYIGQRNGFLLKPIGK